MGKWFDFAELEEREEKNKDNAETQRARRFAENWSKAPVSVEARLWFGCGMGLI